MYSPVHHASRLDDVLLAVSAARVVVVSLLGNGGPALELLAHGNDAALGRRSLGAAGQVLEVAVGEDGSGASGGLGVDRDCLPVDVVNVVAGKVVARIVGGSAGEQTRRGNANVDEAHIVGTGTERGVLGGETLLGKVIVEEVGAEGVAGVVTAVDGEHGVDGTNHIVVEVEADLVGILLGQSASVVEGADEADLLSAPPDEADLVLEALVLLEGADDLEDGAGARAVIVDTRAGGDRVQVSTEDDDVVGVALLGLGNDVPGLTLLIDGVDEQLDRESLTSAEAGLPGLTDLKRDGANGGNEANVLEAESGASDGVTGLVVVEDDANGTLGSSKLQLLRDGTSTSLDEGELARSINALPLVSEAARTADVINRGVNELGGDTLSRGRGVVGQSNDDNVLAIRTSNRNIVELDEGMVEVLDPRVDGGGETSLNALQDEVRGGLVARVAVGTVAAVVTGDLVEVPEVTLNPGKPSVRCSRVRVCQTIDSLLGLNVSHSLLRRERVRGKAANGEKASGEGGDGLHDGSLMGTRSVTAKRLLRNKRIQFGKAGATGPIYTWTEIVDTAHASCRCYATPMPCATEPGVGSLAKKWRDKKGN